MKTPNNLTIKNNQLQEAAGGCCGSIPVIPIKTERIQSSCCGESSQEESAQTGSGCC
ncbi:hypothetical protein ACFSTE_17805 [Aquimarina hainanensis]|uniref:Class I lanthipeptide n=1 Tax=Aquimarina hainanensis TaxID=1578017 RepID=A0ABW5NCX8_9FLAO|nr:hypothetical protein [Aquimarina sp. TRL1]QKX06808.1 hypothetical protein HN014_18430 [Aquimarina sp. TRL1]